MIGRRDINADPYPDTLRWRMTNGVTGRQLTVDGSLAVQFVNFDPNGATANTTQVWVDGAIVIYIRAGVKELWTFDRANGWQEIT